MDTTYPHKFYLKEAFKKELCSKSVTWGFGGLSEFTFYRTYSRKKDNGNMETWAECVIRVIEGMFTILKTHAYHNKVPWYEKKGHRLAEEAAIRLFDFKWTPPGRGLWMMGTDYMWERGAMSLYNCAYVSTKDIDYELSKPFAFVMDTMMQGVGCGYDTAGAEKIIVNIPKGEPELIIVDDTREGWVEAISCLIDSYLEEGSTPVNIDTHLVREYGSPIKGFGGEASGPIPLIQGFNGIKDILGKRDNNFLTSTGIVSIMDIIGKIVVAGNVRRSALLALGDSNDKEYMELKNWSKNPIAMGIVAPDELKEINEAEYHLYNENFDDRKWITEKYINESWSYKFGGYLWASNNSLYGYEGMDYIKAAENITINGEPGFFWIENAKKYGRMKDGIKNDDLLVSGLNPCAEIALESYETCNLNENYPVKHKDYWDFQRTLKFSYLYSKAVTLIPTNWQENNSVVSRNRRIGCSISGIQECIIKLGRHEFTNWCDRAYNYINYLDEKYSNWLGIPKSKRKTTVKPSGTVSLLAGSLPGIHHPESNAYYRTIRIASNSELIKILSDAGYRMEPAASDPTKTTVVYFPVIHDEKHISKDKVSIWRQFKDTAMLQRYWSDNAVSVTITFSKEESNQISECLSAFERELKSVSLLPLNEHVYEQAPYIATPKEEIIEYQKTLKPLDFSSLHIEGENANSNKFCTNEGCEL